MKNAGPIKKLRFRPIGANVSLFTQVAFIISLFFTCLCGPYCAGAPELAQEASDCCSACPVEEAPLDKDTHCDCCVLEQSDFIYELTTLEAPICHTAQVERIIEWLQPPQQKTTDLHSICTTDTSQGPPSYLRFETFLI